MNALAVVGSIASIIGFILSIILFIRTGNIQDNVKTALNQSAKVLAYNKHKQEIYCELNDCIKFFLDEHTLKEQKPYIQKMDAALSEFQTYHPDLPPEIEEDIKTIRASYNGKNADEPIGYLTIIHPMNNIIAILKQEDSFFYDQQR